MVVKVHKIQTNNLTLLIGITVNSKFKRTIELQYRHAQKNYHLLGHVNDKIVEN